MKIQSKKYEQIVEMLATEIAGREREGRESPARFPSERSLAQRFGVSRETVRKAVGELEERGMIYRRSGVGSFVSGKARGAKTRIAALFTGSCDCEVFSVIEREIVRQASAAGFDVVRPDVSGVDAGDNDCSAVELARKIAAERVQGVIFQPVDFSEATASVNVEIIRIFSGKGIPVVLVDRDAEESPGWSGCTLVALDNLFAGRQLAEHLKNRLVGRVAFIAREGCAESVRRRMAGVKSVFGDSSVDYVTVPDHPSREQLISALSRLSRLDSIVCQNDAIAVKVAEALASMGLSVPSDVLLAGFDDIAVASRMHPQLTTIRQPCEQIATVAFRRLRELMKEPSLPAVSVLLHGELKARGSTDIYR